MNHHAPEHQTSEPYPEGQASHERVMVKTGSIWAAAIGLATLIVVSLGLMRAFQLALNNGRPLVHPNRAEQQLSLIKRMAPLDPNQRLQRDRYEKEQKYLLSHYSWVDQKQQLARIPIDRAMSLIVQKYGKAE